MREVKLKPIQPWYTQPNVHIEETDSSERKLIKARSSRNNYLSLNRATIRPRREK